MKLAIGTALVLLSLIQLASAADVMKAFPAAQKGMVRYVLTLPKEANESSLKVELLVGKTVSLDPGNNYFFAGKLETKVAQGWGYTYYSLPKLGPMAGTLMAVDPSVPKVDRFISLGQEPMLVRYNSKLPLVIYVPDGVEVRYRLWRAPTEATPVNPG